MNSLAIRSLAKRYMLDNLFFGYTPHLTPATLAPHVLATLADYYSAQEGCDLAAETGEAYAQLKTELGLQFEAIRGAGIRVLDYTFAGEPYKGSPDLFTDLRDSRRLIYKPTGVGEIPEWHALAECSGYYSQGRPMLWNDVFRVVHDFFGHAQGEWNFAPSGEVNAWFSHGAMFSPLALRALTTETLLQTAWVNYGAHLRRFDGSLPVQGDADYIPLRNRPFAPQRTFATPQGLIQLVREVAQ